MKGINMYERIIVILIALSCVLSMASLRVSAEEAEEPSVITEETEVSENIGAVSNDDLFAGYVDRLFGIKNDVQAEINGQKKTGERFDVGTTSRSVYDKLVPAAKAIAAGEESSTVIEFADAAEIGFGEENAWTAEDLGVSAIVVNGKFTAEAKEALKVKVTNAVNMDKVIDALLADYPYEFYWFDKTKGVFSEFGYSAFGYKENDVIIWQAYITSYTVSFAVSGEYAGSAEYTVDTSIAQTAVNAASNAKTIVTEHAGETDKVKLDSYRTEICNLVDYNHAAVNNNVPYGNPWQLIWVFDADPDTKVVCEGYSKAFQYLCDQTDFYNDAITCYTVRGTMGGGTGEGRHMWNIVTMDDGVNYLADITNCDDGSIGNPDDLFLKGYTYKEAYEGTEEDDDGNIFTYETTKYTFSIKGVDITYYYDSGTEALYTEEELIVSSDDYVENQGPEPQASQIILSPKEASLTVGQTLQLTALAIEVNDIVWSSSDKSVAAVDNEMNKGSVTALKEGTAVIRAESADNPDVYDECIITVTDTYATFLGTQLELEGKIIVDFYVEVPEEYAGAEVVMSTEDDVTRVPVEDGEASSYGNAKLYKYYALSTQMRDTITLYVEKNGEKVPMKTSSGTDYTNGYEYTILKSLNNYRNSSDENLVNLANAMDAFGQYVQILVKHNEEGLTPPQLDEVPMEDLDTYASTRDADLETLKYAGARLELNSDTTIWLYYQPVEGHTLNEYTFTVDNKTAVVEESGGYYILKIRNIKSNELGHMYSIKVTDGTNTQTLNYSALSYAQSIITKNSDVNNVNACKAIYWYYKMAVAYFGEV